jgi:hypothetical protein
MQVNGIMSFIIRLFMPVILGGRWRTSEEVGYIHHLEALKENIQLSVSSRDVL